MTHCDGQQRAVHVRLQPYPKSPDTVSASLVFRYTTRKRGRDTWLTDCRTLPNVLLAARARGLSMRNESHSTCRQKQALAAFLIFRQTVHCLVPDQSIPGPRVTRRRRLARFVERAGRNINHVKRLGICVSQWRSAITTKAAKNSGAGFERLWCALYPTESALAHTEPCNRRRCR